MSGPGPKPPRPFSQGADVPEEPDDPVVLNEAPAESEDPGSPAGLGVPDDSENPDDDEAGQLRTAGDSGVLASGTCGAEDGNGVVNGADLVYLAKILKTQR